MAALVMVLAAAMMVPGDGPERVSGEIAEPQPLNLTGKWEGMIIRPDGSCSDAALDCNSLVTWRRRMRIITQWTFRDRGSGKFRLATASGEFLGLYQWQDGNIVFCYRPANKGYPISVRKIGDDDRSYLLILHRVKSPK